MKMDKEALVKHRFWLILGVFGLLWFIGFLTVSFGAAGPIAEAIKKYTTTDKKTTGPAQKEPKNDNFYKPWIAYGDKFTKHKDVVWEQAWNLQKSLVTFPSSGTAPTLQKIWDDARSFQDWKVAVSQEPHSTTARTEYRQRLYLSQFGGLEELVIPVEFKGGKSGFETLLVPANNPVAAAGGPGGGRPNLPFGVGGGGANASSKTIANLLVETPSVEELWLAQEDFWVKRELLRAVKSTLEEVGRMVRFEPKDKKDSTPPPGAKYRYNFHNTNWELSLIFGVNKENRALLAAESTIKNVSDTRRALLRANPTVTPSGPLEFRLKQGASDYLLKVRGEVLAWNQSDKLGEQLPIDTIDPSKPFEVEEVFDWTTSPIRRIDDLRVGYHSHRTANVALKPGLGFLQDGAAAGSDPSASQPVVQQPMLGAPAPAAENTAATRENKLDRNRYLYVTEQCRHLPLGMVLVVDQAHVHDVLVTLANSPLRLQISQVQLQHVRSIQCQLAAAGGTGAGTGTGPGGKPPPTGLRPLPQPMPLGSSPSASGPNTVGPDPNLVELTLYGVAALYEKFPGKKEETTPKN